MLEEAEELVDFVPCPYRGTGTRRRSLGIDGYAFDEADGSLRLVIAEFEGERQPATVTQTTAKATFSKVVAFVDEAFAGNDDHLPADEDPAADFSGLLQIHQPNITRLRFYLVTDGILSDRIRDWPEQSIGGIPAEFHIWDIARFHDALSSRSGREALTVDFGSLVAGGVPCLKASLNQSEYSGYLCVLPADALARMYEEYGSRLLEGNVRSFLGKAVKVNKAIRETVLRSRRCSCIQQWHRGDCNSVETRDTPRSAASGGDRSTDREWWADHRIALSHAARRRRARGIFVQMKLSVVDEKSPAN
jgi:hypothetical protein